MPKHILLVGCGRWGANILRDLRALGCRVSIADVSPEHRTVASLDEVEGVDGVVIATPASVHAESIREVLRFDCPIFVEKPLTTSSADARRAIEECEGRLFVMDKWRYHGGVEELRRIARTAELGRPVSLHTKRLQEADTQSDVETIWTLAPHDLAIAHEILGVMPQPLDATAEECGEGRSGVVARLTADGVPVTMEVSACRPNRERSVALACEEGTATLVADDRIIVETPRGTETRTVTSDPPLYRELEAFLGYLDGGEKPRGTADDALAAIEVIERIQAMKR